MCFDFLKKKKEAPRMKRSAGNVRRPGTATACTGSKVECSDIDLWRDEHCCCEDSPEVSWDDCVE